MRIAIYKPSNEIKNGSAFQFSIGTKRNSKVPVMFVEGVRQSKPKPPAGSTESPFNWKEEKLTMMLNVDELGQLAACITGLTTKELKFVHASEPNGVKKTSTLRLSPPMTDEQLKFGNWSLSMSTTVDSVTKSVNGYIDPGSIYRIKVLADDILSAYNHLAEGRETESESF
jgi:hypothetical protein